MPITIGGLARHNVANALAAAGGARGLGATIDQVRDGLLDFAPDAERSPGRLNLFRLGAQGRHRRLRPQRGRASAAVLDVAEGIAGGAAGRAAPITAIIGTAGDRPDDTLRGIGRIAGRARPAGRDQGDAQVPARPDRRVGRRRAAGRGRGGRRLRRRRPDLRLRDRGAPGRAQRRGRRRRQRRPAGCRRGSSC